MRVGGTRVSPVPGLRMSLGEHRERCEPFLILSENRKGCGGVMVVVGWRWWAGGGGLVVKRTNAISLFRRPRAEASRAGTSLRSL